MEQGREVYYCSYINAPVVGVAVDPVEDTEGVIIIGKLEEISLKLTAIESSLRQLTTKLETTNTDVYNLGVTVEDFYDLQSSHNETVHGYLSNFFELFITVLAVIVFVRLAQWIEWLFTDR